MKFNTKCVHGSGKPDDTGAISPAIYMSSTFSHPKLGDTTGYQYSRESNPTRDRLEQLMAGLEEGTDALAFSSGIIFFWYGCGGCSIPFIFSRRPHHLR